MKKAQLTRQALLQKAFEQIYTGGYQTTSIDAILAATAVTKGAFYYHFKNKDEMGLALIEEVLRPTLRLQFESLLQSSDDPLQAIYRLMQHLLFENDLLQAAHGCPMGNLTQELTPWHPVLSTALDQLLQDWIQLMTQLLQKGQQSGFIKTAVSARSVALFVLSGYWGVRSIGKLGDSRTVYTAYLNELKRYLNTLR
ncbi:MAG: TetR/AcrR family transcriptional regulator [Sphingobacteriales bacterium]|nr:MAG: TetR/AcrR family transcriptional regulator [Sphingobacteriales bacterium]